MFYSLNSSKWPHFALMTALYTRSFHQLQTQALISQISCLLNLFWACLKTNYQIRCKNVFLQCTAVGRSRVLSPWEAVIACSLCPVYSIVSFWWLSLQKTPLSQTKYLLHGLSGSVWTLTMYTGFLKQSKKRAY